MHLFSILAPALLALTVIAHPAAPGHPHPHGTAHPHPQRTGHPHAHGAGHLHPHGTAHLHPQGTAHPHPSSAGHRYNHAGGVAHPSGTAQPHPQGTQHPRPQGTAHPHPQGTAHLHPQGSGHPQTHRVNHHLHHKPAQGSGQGQGTGQQQSPGIKNAHHGHGNGHHQSQGGNTGSGEGHGNSFMIHVVNKCPNPIYAGIMDVSSTYQAEQFGKSHTVPSGGTQIIHAPFYGTGLRLTAEANQGPSAVFSPQLLFEFGYSSYAGVDGTSYDISMMENANSQIGMAVNVLDNGNGSGTCESKYCVPGNCPVSQGWTNPDQVNIGSPADTTCYKGKTNFQVIYCPNL